eukprot:CAMPEP_0178632664 /NCGR_PEP_ID=MMETSP0698-20121128/11658_1 /TAXON_ID=265572 /ORGANISM="Extubocellulus spinifer, Strain CCMP396" /LENGTH=49 /DNA_ID= /DNA_START= /DNA_END= /DNA_ORIENTATION=
MTYDTNAVATAAPSDGVPLATRANGSIVKYITMIRLKCLEYVGGIGLDS